MDTRPVYTLSTKPVVLASHDEAVDRAVPSGMGLRERPSEGDTLRRQPDLDVGGRPLERGAGPQTVVAAPNLKCVVGSRMSEAAAGGCRAGRAARIGRPRKG